MNKLLFIGGTHGNEPIGVEALRDIEGNGTDDFVLMRQDGGTLNWITKAAPSGNSYISHIFHGGWPGDVPVVGQFGA